MQDAHLAEEIFEPYKQQMEQILSSKKLTLKQFNAQDQKLLFDAASGFYQIAEFEKAALIFRSLILTAPRNTCYWQSLASALQMNKDYTEAIKGWSILMGLKPENNALFFLRSAECFLLDGKIKEGKQALEDAKKLCKQDDPIQDELEHLMGVWEDKTC